MANATPTPLACQGAATKKGNAGMESDQIKRSVQPSEERGPEYYVVCTEEAWLRVSPQTARILSRMLRKRLQPRWVRVIDISGAEILLRPRDIKVISESTPEQREYQRRLTKKLEQEEEDEDGAEPAWG